MRYLVIVALVVSAACASAPPTLSPVGLRAFTQTRVVKGLDAFRDVAIAAADQQPPLVSRAVTNTIVDYHQATLQTMTALGSSWATVARTGLDAVTATLTPAEQAVLAPYVALVKTLLAEVQ